MPKIARESKREPREMRIFSLLTRVKDYRWVVFANVLKRLQEKVRDRQYIVTSHARKEMLDDDLSTHDVEGAILTGQIDERQKDRITAESKYRIRGEASDGRRLEVVAKFSLTDKMVVITVYTV